MQRFMGRHSLLFSAMVVAMPVMAENSHYGSPLVFDQVVVTATKTENSLADAPASMSVITSEEIQSSALELRYYGRLRSLFLKLIKHFQCNF